MSHFTCDECGTVIVDSPKGYLTECEHFPKDPQKKPPQVFVCARGKILIDLPKK